jgi:Zn finger protein HypA/HybF involved in hydrogenase expression
MMGNNERESINELRVSCGMRPLAWKNRRCMLCEDWFKVWGFAAYCPKCKEKMKEIENEAE